MWNLHQLLGSQLWTLHVALSPLVLAIPRRISSLRPDEGMKDGVAWAWAWTIPTVFVRKLLKVTRQNDTAGGLIRQERMRCEPIRTKPGHPIKHIDVPDEDDLLPYRRCNDILSDTIVQMLWSSTITQIKYHEYSITTRGANNT